MPNTPADYQSFGSRGTRGDLLDEQPDIHDKPNAEVLTSARGEIRFDHVKFSYDMQDEEPLAVLKDMDFLIKPGRKNCHCRSFRCREINYYQPLIKAL